MAIGSEATFVARSVDAIFQQHLKGNFAESGGSSRRAAYVEILQNCNIFNDGAWQDITEKATRAASMSSSSELRQARSSSGKKREKGIRMNGFDLEVVELRQRHHAKTICSCMTSSIHELAYAFLLAHMEHREGFPTPIGVLRAWNNVPRYEDLIAQQPSATFKLKKGKGRSSHAPARRRHLGTKSIGGTATLGRALGFSR